MGKNSIRCDACGKFISHKELENKEASCCFVPDTDLTFEELKFRCKKCTEKYGKIESRQSCMRYLIP